MAPLNKQRTKSRPPKMTTQTLLDFDLGESSSDSDFRIEDHTESDDDFSGNSNEDDSGQDDEDTGDSDDSDDDNSDDSNVSKNKKNSASNTTKKSKDTKLDLKNVIEKAASINALNNKIPTNPICCVCLGDRSDESNEIIDCDSCGASVHEGCYGVSDSNSVSSSASSCPTEPWFCEACRASVIDPSCELCPNKGGIFKETDVGKWVHLVCALYIPGVAFGEVDHLTSVTLFEMAYSKWGAKTCSLCEDAKYARTGVCIGCDAGMCKTYFHVTCAQAAGFLSEAHSEEADQADPFYAHCKVHSDKSMIKHRKRNYNTLKVRMELRKLSKMENQNEKPTTEKLRIQRKLAKHQTKFRTNKSLKNEPWVPTQKMPRLLTTSATACKRLMHKAELMGIDTAALEFQEAQLAALADVRRKWHIPPAFSVEFVGYYLDRITRLKDLKSNLERYLEENKKLIEEQQCLREEYDNKSKQNADLLAKTTSLRENISELHKQIQFLCPDKTFPTIENVGRSVMIPSPAPPSRPMSVPTAAALKMGVGFPLVNLSGGTKDDTGRILSTQRQNNDLLHQCGICKRCNDQHLLAKCDTCHFYYHLGCLNPPLTRHPKKSKSYGWQCSECDKSDDSDGVVEIPKGPRKSRTRFSKDGSIVPCDPNNSSNTESNLSNKSIEMPITREKIKKELQNAEDELSCNSLNSNPIVVNKTKAEKKDENQFKPVVNSVYNKINSKGKELSTFSPANCIPKCEKNEQQQTNDKNCNKDIFTTKIKTENAKCNPAQDLNAQVNANESTTSSNRPRIKDKCKVNINRKIKRERSQSQEEGGEVNCVQKYVKKPKTDNKESKEISVLTKEENCTSPKKCKEKNNARHSEIKNSKEINEASAQKALNDLENENDSKADVNTEQKDNVVSEDKSVDETNQKLNSKPSEQNVDPSHKQNRKKRKDKHKNKYADKNASDNEKSPGKEHKRKRKKKSHDRENNSNDVPKIKIKLKPLPLPGEAAPEPQFFYVSADMVRDGSRPTSVETIDESTTNADDLHLNNSPAFQSNENIDKIMPSTSTPNLIKTSRNNSPTKLNNVKSQLLSPSSSPPTSKLNLSIKSGTNNKISRLLSPRRLSNKRDSTSSSATTVSTKQSKTKDKTCDVCAQSGNNQNLVQCDECNKNYHFTCLDPPLKKTPKRRGYSWHCADCDPTDHESAQ